MKTINLNKMKAFIDSCKNKYVITDMKNGFMNAIYASLPSSSITRSLLQRIRESNGEIEITSAEENVFLSLIIGEKINGLPADALLFELNKEKFQECYREDMTLGEECALMREVIDNAYNEIENINKQNSDD